MPLWFSNDIEYWKPEHPPPTTPIRRPAGIGFCVAIISRTLLIADGVRVTGVVETGAAFTTSAVGVTVEVAIGEISLYIYQSSVVAHHRSGKPNIRTQKAYSEDRCASDAEDAAISPTPHNQPYHRKTMKPLLYLANAFINTFGITQPTPKTANRAAWFIAVMLFGVIAAVGAVAGFAIYWLTRH